MKVLTRFLLWTLLSLVLLAGMDQAFLRIQEAGPVWKTARGFYLDFRGRLISLLPSEKPRTVEAIIEGAGRSKQGPPAAASKGIPSAAPKASKRAGEEDLKALRYVYVDERGELQFADSLEEVPSGFRREAQALKER